jgi:hypothetical protein
MSGMQGLATPKAIHQFVHALLDNQDIDTALNALFSQGTSHSFFNNDATPEKIKCSIINL